NIASNTSPAAMASGDVDAANHSPLDLLIRFPSCLDLDAGFNHQMQSNPGMPTSDHEYGHHQLPSAEHGHSAYVQALGLITSRQEHASNRICGRSPRTPGRRGSTSSCGDPSALFRRRGDLSLALASWTWISLTDSSS